MQMQALIQSCTNGCDLMQVMVLVDNAGGLWPSINHSPWNGITLADFVMPFFLFIVGVALSLTYKVWCILTT
jgi:predicted acyltransferase